MPTVIGTRRRSKSVAEDVPQLTSPVGIHPGPIRTSSPSNISASDVTSAESDNDDSDEDGILRKNPSSPASPRLEHEAVVPDLSSPPPASWTDIDPSVLLALSAPVGSWLTGGDHVKNLFLVLLLIVYLHQLITVPWELYLKARSRRPHPLYQPPSNDDSGGELSRIRQLARSELRQLELIYLLLTVGAPFVGASVLQYTLRSLGGVDTLSWFSTTLFVLATGVRPWSHLIHRLRSRTEDLHSTVHYPPHESQAVSDSKLKALLERVKSLETELAEVKRTMATETRVQDVYDDLGSSLDIIERTIQKNERRVDAMRSALDTRVNTVEKTVARALGKHRSTTHISTSLPPYALPQAASHPHTAHIFSGIIRILYVLWSFATLSFIIKPAPNEFSPTSPSRRMHRNGRLPPHRMKSPPAQLETIQEDSQEVQNGGLGSSDSDSDSFDPGSPSTAQDRDTLAGPSSSADLAANIVTIPYRLSVKLLAALSPPVQRLWG